jgi:hypothetical protein
MDVLSRRYGVTNGSELTKLVAGTMREVRAMFLAVGNRIGKGGQK